MPTSYEFVYEQFESVIECLIDALMSQSQVSRERASEAISKCLHRCETEISQEAFRLHPELPVSEHALLRWTNDSVCHYELVGAECVLMHSVLEGEIINFDSLKHAISTLFWAQLKLQSAGKKDREYTCGVGLAWGFLHLLSVLLPAHQSILLGLAELNSNNSLSNACSLLSACANSQTIHGRLAKLLLLYAHTHLTMNAHEASLLFQEHDTSDSPLFILFKAKLLHMRSPPAALKLLLQHASLQRTLLTTHFALYGETVKCLAEQQRWNEALQYHRLIRVNASSGRQLASLLYTEAVLIQAVSGRLSIHIKSSPEISQLIKEICRLPPAKAIFSTFRTVSPSTSPPSTTTNLCPSIRTSITDLEPIPAQSPTDPPTDWKEYGRAERQVES